MKFVDLSGYMFSGKAAYADLLREFHGVSLSNYRSEFDLLRMPHGLMNLKSSFKNWSPIGTDKALREFVKLAEVLARTPKGIQRFYQIGFSFEAQYPGFVELTKEFVASLVDKSWKMQFPYEAAYKDPVSVFLLRVGAKLRGKYPWPEIDYHLCEGKNFEALAKTYVEHILTSSIKVDGVSTVVTNNALEPFDPGNGFSFFDDIKSIVVDRDVRDVFMTAVKPSKGFNDNVAVYSRISGAFNVEVFIARQKILRARTVQTVDPRIMRVRFEDLVLKYDQTCSLVTEHLGLDDNAHLERFRFFDPGKSEENVGLWKTNGSGFEKEIDKIEQELPELCYLS